MLKRLLLGALAVSSAAFLLLPAGACRQKEFRLAGTVTVASHLIPKTPKDHSVLFIIVKNKGGVPVALKRIVNPHFPVRFDFDPPDLLVPELRGSSSLTVTAEMNLHGNVGQPRPGDLFGHHPDPVSVGQRDVHIVLDDVVR